jgi:aflatoxin B1 aldehyde reductase
MASSTAKSALSVVFGAMTIGKAGVEGIRVTDLATAGAMLDTFAAHGHDEVDTARVYGGGSTEEFLGELDWQKRGIVMDTKLYPSGRRALAVTATTYTHEPESVRKGLLDSMKALNTDKVDMWYLHGPDRQVPFAETLKEVDTLYKEGYFRRFGISNYMSWEVAAMCELCEANGWVKPVVYQGIYNALHRGIEPELMTCMRKYGIALYAFQPLAGGFLTSRYKREMKAEEHEEGSRFDPKRWQGALHRGRYWNDLYFDALDIIRPVAQQHGLTEAECALRWMNHHSLMSAEKGDKIIIGASSVKQLEQNLVDLEKGPLPDQVVEALNAGWALVKGVVPNYFH